MGLAVADIDLATTREPQEVTARAEAAGIRVVPTGFDHGTVTLVIDGRGFEVTTLRHDVVPKGRHAEVAFGADWPADAARRDFTMNALYADAEGRVHDHVGGLADIATRTVRFIGEADARIAEDHLRILRYFRFYAWYGEGRPDAAALKACARAKETLRKLSAERIWKELKTLFAAPDPGRALLWMRQAGVLDVILPESTRWGIDAIPGLVSAEADFGWRADPLLRLMAIVPPDEPRLAALAERLRMSRAEADRLADWAATPAPPANAAGTVLDRLLYRHGTKPVIDRLKLALANLRVRPAGDERARLEEAGSLFRLIQRAEKWERPVFPITGLDLLAVGMVPGAELGRRMKKVEEHWIEGNFTADREALIAFAMDLPAPD
jgi:tRNA nucleotidyltransferase/poly(A) polymerase